MPAERAVHLPRHRIWAGIVDAECANRCLQVCHEQRRRKTLASHISDRQPEPCRRELQHVVTVAAKRGGWFPHRRHLAARDLGKRRRQQRALDPLRMFELARGVRVGFPARSRLIEFAAHGLRERGVLPRFVDEGPRASAHRFDRCFDAAPTSHDNYRQQTIALVDLAEEFETFTPRRRIAGVIQIHEEQVVVPDAQSIAHFLDRAGGVGLEARTAQQQAKRGDHVGLVRRQSAPAARLRHQSTSSATFPRS